MFAHMCLGGTSYTLLSWLPTYFKESFPHSQVLLPSKEEDGSRGPRRCRLLASVFPTVCDIQFSMGGGRVCRQPVCPCRGGCTT